MLSYAGANGTAIDAFIKSGTEALIIASLAPGMPTPDQILEITSAIKKNIKIIYSTRAGSGRVLRRESMVREGIISADNLNPQKARVLAMLALFTSSTSLGGWVYLLTAIVLNAIFVTMAFKIWVRDEPEAEADNFKVERNFFRYSLMYLFLQFGSILVDLGLGTNFSWGFL